MTHKNYFQSDACVFLELYLSHLPQSIRIMNIEQLAKKSWEKGGHHTTSKKIKVYWNYSAQYFVDIYFRTLWPKKAHERYSFSTVCPRRNYMFINLFPILFCNLLYKIGQDFLDIYWVTQKLPQIYTANHATFPIRIRKITVQICDNFWVTQYSFIY